MFHQRTQLRKVSGYHYPLAQVQLKYTIYVLVHCLVLPANDHTIREMRIVIILKNCYAAAAVYYYLL